MSGGIPMSSVSISCSSCGESLASGMAFCPACGHPADVAGQRTRLSAETDEVARYVASVRWNLFDVLLLACAVAVIVGSFGSWTEAILFSVDGVQMELLLDRYGGLMPRDGVVTLL